MTLTPHPASLMSAAALLAALALPAACGSSSPPAGTRSAPAPAGAPAPADLDAGAASSEGRWFVETGCARCHAVAAYGVRAEVPIGPDLGLAKDNVKARFGVQLEEFFENTPGTMALVLSSQIVMTKEEKQDAIRRLEAAYEAHKKLGG